jgi:hypothetical protein
MLTGFLPADATIFETDKIEQSFINPKIRKLQHMEDYLKEHGKTADFDGEVYSVYLENGLHCVFKVTTDEILGELIAYKISKEFGFGNVPPTIYVTLDLPIEGQMVSKTGYLSLFVDSPIDLAKYSDEEFFALLAKMDPEEVANFKIFNFVFGNFDVGVHNTLIYKYNNKLYPILIDNEGISNEKIVEYGDIPFVKFHYFDSIDDFPFSPSNIYSCDKGARSIFKKHGYNPPNYEHNFMIFKNSYWVQYKGQGHALRIKKLLYPDFIPENTKKSLDRMEREKLLNIFPQDEAMKSNVKRLIEQILERRDMLVKHNFGLTRLSA